MFDVIIIGGGIVGLATGYQILKEFPDKKFLVLEKEKNVGNGHFCYDFQLNFDLTRGVWLR